MMYIEYNNLYKEAESRGITPLDILEALHQLKMPVVRLDRFALAQFVNLLGTEIQ